MKKNSILRNLNWGIGAAMGISFWLAFDNLALGIGLGIAMAFAFAPAFRNSHDDPEQKQ